MPTIAFRALHIDDMLQLFLWLLRPHVCKWYAPAPSSFVEVMAKYGPRTAPGNVVRAYIIEVDGAPAGYIQTYAVRDFPDYAAALECGDGVAAVDLFLGEEAMLHHGLGASVVERFVDDVVFAQPGVRACVADPAEGNTASIRAFEKAGFTRWKALRPADGEPGCVLRKDRAGDTPPA
jgi:RimJ/RimL family protein N-acetyltransferase